MGDLPYKKDGGVRRTFKGFLVCSALKGPEQERLWHL